MKSFPVGRPQHNRVPEVPGQHHRLHGHAELLHRHDPDLREEVAVVGLLQHHQDPAAVQVDQALARLEDPHPHVQGLRQGAGPAGVLPRPRHRRLRQPGVLRGEDAGGTSIALSFIHSFSMQK